MHALSGLPLHSFDVSCKYIGGAMSFSRKTLHMRYHSQYVTKDVTFIKYFTPSIRLCGW